jgi:hypothetical protein
MIFRQVPIKGKLLEVHFQSGGASAFQRGYLRIHLPQEGIAMFRV